MAHNVELDHSKKIYYMLCRDEESWMEALLSGQSYCNLHWAGGERAHWATKINSRPLRLEISEHFGSLLIEIPSVAYATVAIHIFRAVPTPTIITRTERSAEFN